MMYVSVCVKLGGRVLAFYAFVWHIQPPTPPPNTLSLVWTDIPIDVRFLGERCMFEKPEERPSFSDLIQELRQFEEQSST